MLSALTADSMVRRRTPRSGGARNFALAVRQKSADGSPNFSGYNTAKQGHRTVRPCPRQLPFQAYAQAERFGRRDWRSACTASRTGGWRSFAEAKLGVSSIPLFPARRPAVGETGIAPRKSRADGALPLQPDLRVFFGSETQERIIGGHRPYLPATTDPTTIALRVNVIIPPE